jgi:hypothetical protein
MLAVFSVVFLLVVLPILTSIIAGALMQRFFPADSWSPRRLAFVLLPALVCLSALAVFLNSRRLGENSAAENKVLSIPETSPTKHPLDAFTKSPAPDTSPEGAFWNKYVDAKAQRRNATGSWSVVLAQQGQPASSEVSGAVVEVLKQKGREAILIFRPNIFEGPGFRELYQADPTLLKKLRNLCEGLVVGEVSEDNSTDPDLQGLITVEVALRLRIFSTNTGAVTTEFAINGRGAGFSLQEAKRQATQRLAEALKQHLQQDITLEDRDKR